MPDRIIGGGFPSLPEYPLPPSSLTSCRRSLKSKQSSQPTLRLARPFSRSRVYLAAMLGLVLFCSLEYMVAASPSGERAQGGIVFCTILERGSPLAALFFGNGVSLSRRCGIRLGASTSSRVRIDLSSAASRTTELWPEGSREQTRRRMLALCNVSGRSRRNRMGNRSPASTTDANVFAAPRHCWDQRC